MTKKLELLAPAGSIEKMKYAFAYGADAVYMGIPDFSLRVRINQFGMKDVADAIAYAHSIGKKIYVTINIMAHNEHIEKLPPYLKKLNIWKPDAMIISDPGVIAMAQKYAPNVPIHLSTQANATNWQTVKFWHEQGLERVVLGREVSLAEIKEIHKKVSRCEIEYFIHGAMCMSYSGRCMLSAWLTGRSANLGDCVQPCRWKYDIDNEKLRVIEASVEEPKHPGMKIPIEEDIHGTYIFNSKDMCFIEYLLELIDSGVVSFKIEGRAKSVAYLATVVKAYRLAFDFLAHDGKHLVIKKQKTYLKKLKKTMLDKLVNRGYTTGFLFGRDGVEQNTENSHTMSDEIFVGEVVSCEQQEKQYKIIIKPHNALRRGDTLRIMQTDATDIKIVLKDLYDEAGNSIESGHGGSGKHVVLYTKKAFEVFSILFKKVVSKNI